MVWPSEEMSIAPHPADGKGIVRGMMPDIGRRCATGRLEGEGLESSVKSQQTTPVTPHDDGKVPSTDLTGR